ncbi:MAG: pseudaminic acid cytidylyltransferase [Alphaproteobacteria bacterium]|nr:pseudaminic acid cytidylyltransferase [Alphaproteobacteria bacterium]
MNLAVIPARSGSKRIANKNIATFCGKPMIAWSIEAVRASGLFDHIIVSTDSEAIAAMATLWGAEVPFMRPAALADDNTGTLEVMAHAVQWAKQAGWDMQAVCCVYATAPFIQPKFLQQGLKVLMDGAWEYVVAAAPYASPVSRGFTHMPEGGIEMLFPDKFSSRTQDLPVAYHDAGQFYWGRPEAWSEQKTTFAAYSTTIEIPRLLVQDIDTPEDWHHAELQHAFLQQHGWPV